MWTTLFSMRPRRRKVHNVTTTEHLFLKDETRNMRTKDSGALWVYPVHLFYNFSLPVVLLVYDVVRLLLLFWMRLRSMLHFLGFNSLSLGFSNFLRFSPFSRYFPGCEYILQFLLATSLYILKEGLATEMTMVFLKKSSFQSQRSNSSRSFSLVHLAKFFLVQLKLGVSILYTTW